MKKLIKQILKESTQEKFINTILSRIKPPYFKNLKKLAADDQEIEIISKMIFGEDITMVNDFSSGDYKIINDEGNEIYYENSGGGWRKRQYDERGNMIYFENSGGGWWKKQYDGRGNEIYHEDSRGFWIKRQYDGDGNQIYHENSHGWWEKWEYDEMGNEIYYENSDDGVILDKR